MRCVLIGNYGVANFGDEALKDYFLQTFPEVTWVVLSANPKDGEYQRIPTGFRSFLSPWLGTVTTFRKADAVVFGGGSLFTDTESVTACFIWWVHAWVAFLFHKPVFLAFQGIGPFKTRRGEWFARSVLKRVAFVSVRDDASSERIRDWNMSISIVQSFDPIYSVFYKRIEYRSTNVFAIIPRANSGQNFTQMAQKLADEKKSAVRILSFEPDDKNEQMICQTIASACGSTDIRSIRSAADLTNALADVSFVYSHRYHGALAALAMHIPFQTLPQKPGDKLSEIQTLADMDGEVLLQLVKTGEEALKQALANI